MVKPEYCDKCGSDEVYFNTLEQTPWCNSCNKEIDEDPVFEEIKLEKTQTSL